LRSQKPNITQDGRKRGESERQRDSPTESAASNLAREMSAAVVSASARAPTNIAVIKYWGKRDSKLNLPINSSLSVTLDQEDLDTFTSVALSPDFERDRVWLNGEEEEGVTENNRLQSVFGQMREMARDRAEMSAEELRRCKIHVVSRNSFPTAAGLASSASGYACLTKALAQAFNVDISDGGKTLTEVARKGSGSASRSLYGGFVKWEMGKETDGKDSIALQVAPENSWPTMHALICVVSDHKKQTSSTSGMGDSVKTSELLKFRAEHIVPKRMAEMEAAVLAKDFKSFAELTMRDSNQFHATCLDTYPPIAYMTDTSHAITRLVHRINDEPKNGIPICAYTFDAGPNAVIFLDEINVGHVLSKLLVEFGPLSSNAAADEFVRGQTSMSKGECLNDCPEVEMQQTYRGELKYIIHTKVGSGAQVVEDESKFLLCPATGLPKVGN